MPLLVKGQVERTDPLSKVEGSDLRSWEAINHLKQIKLIMNRNSEGRLR